MKAWVAETRGAAAVEFAIWMAVLTLPILSVVDFGTYIFRSMQLKEAAQAAAQAAWRTCDPSKGNYLPAATNCPNLQTVLATAAHSTSLGTNAVLKTSAEWYVCADTTHTLQNVDSTDGVINTTGTNVNPATTYSSCKDAVVAGSTFTGNTNKPGDYILVTVWYTYTPTFHGVSAASMLASPIKQTAWMRLD